MQDQLALYIDGAFCRGATDATGDIFNPATGKVIGQLPHAKTEDMDRALAAAQRGFETWRKMTANDRSRIMRKAAELIRERVDLIAEAMTREQGKPLAEARMEVLLAPEHIEWCAEEGRRLYGRVVPSRMANVRQTVLREPVGPVAAFAPWNFPVNQSIRKIAGALAAGCSIIIKCPEESPSCCIEMVRCFHDAGLPPGVLNLLFGVPAEISSYLIASPIIRKISFTGSVAVGKHLASLAGQHMKRATMELGGHSPVLVFDDSDVELAAKATAANKFRNAGQVCVAPTRLYVQDRVYDRFVSRFTEIAKGLKVGDGMEPANQMGPLAASRRLDAMDSLVSDAEQRGATILAGGKRSGNQGYFFPPTVLTDIPDDALMMTEEPFGPLAPIVRFADRDEALKRANSLPFGLAAYFFTKSLDTANVVLEGLEAGLVSLNGAPLNAPETPFGGVKDSGYGSEGGSEGLDAYLTTKLFAQAV
jgi:succinate-semialdehyde dehydrogenase/glutarate-semialdehyde dehydrogenase